jgi:hypothetical protein
MTTRATQNTGPLERLEDLAVHITSAFHQITHELGGPFVCSLPVLGFCIYLFLQLEFGGYDD